MWENKHPVTSYFGIPLPYKDNINIYIYIQTEKQWHWFDMASLWLWLHLLTLCGTSPRCWGSGGCIRQTVGDVDLPLRWLLIFLHSTIFSKESTGNLLGIFFRISLMRWWPKLCLSNMACKKLSMLQDVKKGALVFCNRRRTNIGPIQWQNV